MWIEREKDGNDITVMPSIISSIGMLGFGG